MTSIRTAAAAGAFATSAPDWTRTEAEALALASSHEGPAIVDLDETLYLRNSTEQLIALATPGIVAAYLLRVLDIVAPWRWTGGWDCRDNWRLLLVLCLFPWTLGRWRRFCRDQASSFVNVPLRDALSGRSDLIVASNGYRRVIVPLMRSFDLPEARLICCDLRRFSHRTGGKLKLVREHLTEQEITSSTVITDSIKDAPLLAVCRAPCLTVWQEARFEEALYGRAYLPGDYLTKWKRPRQRAMRMLVKEDLIPWILAGLGTQLSVQQAAALFVLFFSMWCFYDFGYYDNDQCALKYEEDGMFTPEAQALVAHGLPLQMVVMGSILGVLGVMLVEAPAGPLIAGGAWFAGMAVLTLVYRWYNRIDKNSRVWVYLLLQAFRCGALFLVVPATAVGYALAGSQMIARWIDYDVYRYLRRVNGKADWPLRPRRMTRLFILVMLLMPLVLTGKWEAFWVPATLGILLFVADALYWDWKSIRNLYRRIDR